MRGQLLVISVSRVASSAEGESMTFVPVFRQRRTEGSDLTPDPVISVVLVKLLANPVSFRQEET